MATEQEVRDVLLRLAEQLERLDPSVRALLPARRTIQAECPDLAVVYHAHWRGGRLGQIQPGRADRADIRITVGSDDLLALSTGQLELGHAVATNRVKLSASMTDLLRLRAVL